MRKKLIWYDYDVMESCILCKKDFSDGIKVKVGSKGCKTLMRACNDRGLHDLYG